MIKRYGVEAVTGRRVLRVGEIRSMTAAENVYDAYQSRRNYPRDKDGAPQWSKWAEDYPVYVEILANAAREAEELDDA